MPRTNSINVSASVAGFGVSELDQHQPKEPNQHLMRTNVLKTGLLAIAFCLSLISFGQDVAKDAKSKAQEFSSGSGKLIEKEWSRIGEVKEMKISAVRYRDLITTNSVSAMRFEMEVKGKYTADTKIAEVDKDEIDGLQKSLEIIKKEITTTKRERYTEIVFTSRTGFQAGCYYEDQRGTWSVFVKIERFDKDSYIFMSPEDLDSLILLVNQAAAQIN